MFRKIKGLLVESPCFKMEMEKPVVLSVDASKNDLGACLIQNNLPVCYDSKSLTKTEQAYVQIEKKTICTCLGM